MGTEVEGQQEDGALRFGELLRRQRLAAGLTQEDLAEWKGLLGLARDRRNAALFLVSGLVAATSLVPLSVAVAIVAVTGNPLTLLLLACLTLNLVISVVGITWSLALIIAAWRKGALAPVAEACSARAQTLPRSDRLLSGEMGRLFQVCARNLSPGGARDGALFAVLYGGCLSISQAVALDMSDYDRESGALAVRCGKKQGATSHLRNGARDAVEDWLAIRGDEPGPLFLPTDPAGKIEFHPATGTSRRMTKRATREALRRRAEEACAAPFTRPQAARDFLPLPDTVIAVFFAGRPPVPADFGMAGRGKD